MSPYEQSMKMISNENMNQNLQTYQVQAKNHMLV